MKVAFRVDGSLAIGTGHVRRMGALAATLAARGAGVRFLWRDLGLDVRSMLPAPGWSLPPLAPPRGPLPDAGGPHGHWGGETAETDATQTLAALSAFAPDWIVLDHYAFDARWHAPVRASSGARLLVVDDLADRPIEADLIVDQNFHPDHGAKFAGANRLGCRLLGGPAYAMLSGVYAEAPRHIFSAAVRSIGIFMGGVDAPNLSGLALEALEVAGFTGPVEIVSTSANPNLAALSAAVAARPGARLSCDLPDLAGFFARHDLQLGAGGGALWERMCIGAPTLAVVAAANQRESVPYLAAIGALAMVDGLAPREVVRDTLAAEVARLIADPRRRRSLAAAASGLVDGRGCDRIAEEMAGMDRGVAA